MTNIEGPDEIYGELFDVVQTRRIFGDSKYFVDATPRSDVASILNDFAEVDHDDDDAIRRFVVERFTLPADDHAEAVTAKLPPLRDRIEQLWDILSRAADQADQGSSLIELPRPYTVPGGRFREIYYWDSYFTMLGLAESGRDDAIEDMVENFAHLIDRIGFVPNGNRSYYCTRSQPPFFVLMVELLAEVRGDEDVIRKYLPQLQREYEFWMSGAAMVKDHGDAIRRVVRVNDTCLNRYWDDSDKPRAESYAEDLAHAARSNRVAGEYFRDIRAACESGWDFSSRWLEDRQSMATIRTTNVIPVDLNALMYNFEKTLARICTAHGKQADAAAYEARAADRKALLQTLFYDDVSGLFMDLSLPGLTTTGTASIATAYPLYFGIATRDQAARVAQRIQQDFLKAGGWVTSNYSTDQQWDSPNGWAPMQWITYRGLERYGFHDEAREGASRWVENNIAVYREHGCLLEKYDVESRGLAGTGGEYEVQEGFGWTNGVLLRLTGSLGRNW
jgi:alpha,alpha-trehalase